MTPRHPVPTRWLMTDERLGEALWPALERLPRGGGVVFRHYGTPDAERRALFARIGRVARRRGLILVCAGAPVRGARGVHGISGRGLVTWPAHDRRAAIAGARAGACALFVSPVFATRSHPGARGIGPARAARIVRGLNVAAIALGGMDERRFRRIRRLGFDGYAAIDAWASRDRKRPDQKRKAVPT